MSLLVLIASRFKLGSYGLWALCGLLLGLLVLIRLYLIPFLMPRVVLSWCRLAAAGGIFLLTVSPQLVYYWLGQAIPSSLCTAYVAKVSPTWRIPGSCRFCFAPKGHGMFFWSPCCFWRHSPSSTVRS